MYRMKTRVLIFLFMLCSLSLGAQIRLAGYRQADINPELLTGRWKARWISMPGEPANVYGVYHMRKTFELGEVPSRFIVHVTADNRYKLYLNGRFVSLGPARGDIYNWNFETVDLAPYLKRGKNVLAAVVWKYAEQKPVAQISFNQTGFLLQGNTEIEAVVNTDASWLCMKNEAYAPWHKPVLGYYVAGPGELLSASKYPWGWEQSAYDDSKWLPARTGIEGGVKGSRDYPGRLLVPCPIPPMDLQSERFEAVRISEGVKVPDGFLKTETSLTVPANSKVHLLLDNGKLTTGYLSLLFSRGKNAEIAIAYAEALYEGKEKGTTKSYSLPAKGNRNEVEGKRFIGYEDKVIADGGEGRDFTTLWWRTWRYVDLTISTADEPLVLEDVYGTFSAYPFRSEIAFSAPGHDELNKMLDIGWHTARLCANETYMDCPYYEQLQYFGDTRIQAMITLYNTHDAYMKTLLPAYRGVLSWYEQWLKPDHSLGYVPHWFFADWAAGFQSGEPVREKEGNSAFQDLMYILTLESAAGMERAFGIPSMADHYMQIASAIRGTIRTKYWDAARGLFADTYDHRSFSQHVNSLAILAGIVAGEEATEVMERTLNDPSLIQATIYFRYYVHQALKAAGMGDRLLDNMQIWRDQMALGLTTWAEMPEPTRSDCHAWGASPNIEFFRILLGIDSNAPGFKSVRIAPSLGNLKEVSGTMPHPAGSVTASYKLDKKGKLTARLVLPAGTNGVFLWKGKEYQLKSGEQVLTVE